MKDGFNRSISYARISLTNSCNLNCSYCSSNNEHAKNLSLEFYKNLIDALDIAEIEKIRFTGGEPLLNNDIIDLIKYTKSNVNIKDIAITTNGILFENFCDDLIESGLNRVNFSLDTLNREVFKKLTGKDCLDKVISNILLAKEKGLKVKINTVLLKGITDNEIDEFLKFGCDNDIQIRFIELMPIGENIDYYNNMYLSQSEILNIIKHKIVNKNCEDVATYYIHNNYEFGIITPISNHFCDSCNRIRITSNGALRLCLHSDNEIDLTSCKNSSEMYNIIKTNITTKPEKHKINRNHYAKSSMVAIGG